MYNINQKKKMKSFSINLKNVAITAAIFAVTAAFAACEPANEPGADAPAITAFSFAGQAGEAVIDQQKRTVKAAAVCGTNLATLTPEFKLLPEGTTAKVNGNLQTSGTTANNYADAVVYTLTTPGGETAEWTVTVTLPDDCPQVKKYITYNKPIDAYYIEFSGGVIAANLPVKNTNCTGHTTNDAFAIAFENRKYSEVHTIGSLWAIKHIRANGTSISSVYGSTLWLGGDAEVNYPSDEYAVEWREKALEPQYPLDQFAAWVSNWKDGVFDFVRDRIGNLSDVANNPEKLYEMPNNTDVTKLYVRSEKVMDIVCDIYQDSEKTSEGTRTWTFWVDPATGFTLKYEATNYNGTIRSKYEVTKLVIGKPDWDGKHLHPLPTDKVE
jgi:hypothetical protein